MTPREERYTAYLGLLLGLLVMVLMLTASGCMTSYDIRVCHEDTNVCSQVTVRSYREFEQPKVTYSKTNDKVNFTFGAAAVTTGTSPIEEAMAKVLISGGSIGAKLMTPIMSPGEPE